MRALWRSAESQDREESFVDPPHLLWAEVSDEFAEAMAVDSPDLLDQDPAALTSHFSLGTE